MFIISNSHTHTPVLTVIIVINIHTCNELVSLLKTLVLTVYLLIYTPALTVYLLIYTPALTVYLLIYTPALTVYLLIYTPVLQWVVDVVYFKWSAVSSGFCVFAGLHRLVTDCSGYYQCWNGVRFDPQFCPAGLLFNDQHKYCDWPRNVGCKPTTNWPGHISIL